MKVFWYMLYVAVITCVTAFIILGVSGLLVGVSLVISAFS